MDKKSPSNELLNFIKSINACQASIDYALEHADSSVEELINTYVQDVANGKFEGRNANWGTTIFRHLEDPELRKLFIDSIPPRHCRRILIKLGPKLTQEEKILLRSRINE